MGELDVASAPVLDEALMQVQESAATGVVIDLTGVQFIDSTGLRVLLTAHARDLQSSLEASTGDAGRGSPRAGDRNGRGNGQQTGRATGRLRITGGSGQAQKLFQLAGVLDKLPFVPASELTTGE